MVGIARPEDFDIFIRKIGYSVGLENTLERFADFCYCYASVPQIKQNDWANLVYGKWGLKTENIKDVFSSLKIVQITTQGIYPGPIGEAGAICIKSLKNPDAQKEALRHLLALAIILADGDIFLNCILGSFDPSKVLSHLQSMVLGKRSLLYEVFQGKNERAAIAAAVTIERQKTNKGGGSKGRVNTINNAGGLTPSGLSALGLPKPIDLYKMELPSADYLRHVLTPRKEWARSIGLVDQNSELTDLGWNWMDVFGKAGFTLESGEYSLMPTRFELEQARLSAITKLVKICPTTWDYIRIVCAALRGSYSPETTNSPSNELSEFTRATFEKYRELSQDRIMMRNEIPLLVVFAVYMALCCATKQPMLNYDAWIKSDEPIELGIKARTSRTIELGIFIS